MRWAEVVLVTSLEASDAVTDILISEGCGGVATEAPSVRIDGASASSDRRRLAAYFPVDDRLPGTLESIKSRTASLSAYGLKGADAEITVKFVEDQDWATAWKSFFKPLVVGRVVVKPTWEEFDAKPEHVVVELDPGMAFGTGNHPTTQMCLLAVQRYIRPGDAMLDVGTGSGILAIAAALLGASKVVGIDIDPIAVKAARENAEVNGVGSAVRIMEGASPGVGEMTADLVTANIVASAIIEMRRDLANAVKPGGLLVTSGIIDTRGEEVEAALKEIGLSTIEVMREGEWVSVISRKQ